MRSITLKSGTDWDMRIPVQQSELLTLYQIRAGLIGPNGNRIGPYLVDGLGLERADMQILLSFPSARTNLREGPYTVVLEFTPRPGQAGTLQEAKLPIYVEPPSLGLSGPQRGPLLELQMQPVAIITRQTRAIIDKSGYLALQAQLAQAFGYDQVAEPDLPDDFTIGDDRPDEVTRKFYRINGCPSGTLLPHDGNSSAIQGYFWPMGMQPQDNLWYARPHDMNNAVLIGPEEETFTGKAALVIFHFPLFPIQINP